MALGYASKLKWSLAAAFPLFAIALICYELRPAWPDPPSAAEIKDQTRVEHEARAVEREQQHADYRNTHVAEVQNVLATAAGGMPKNGVVALPDWVTSVYVGPGGNAYFGMRSTMSANEDDISAALIDCATNKSQVFWFGEILYKDRSGRLWATLMGNEMSCVDPKTKKAEHVRVAFADFIRPDARVEFIKQVWEDRKGNIWLISISDRGLVSHALDTNGKWTHQIIINSPWPLRSVYSQSPKLVELTDGTMALFGAYEDEDAFAFTQEHSAKIYLFSDGH